VNLIIRKAQHTESEALTDISFASKRFWNYPKEYMDIWKNELTITPTYINQNLVFVAEADTMLVGYFSIVEIQEDFWAGKVLVKKGFWLEHIFIKPEFIGKKIGAELIAFLKELCKKNKIERLFIFSDPNAKGFYDKVGAKYIEESPSSIEGRTVSLYELAI
jgi:GNAT superfamily N-acetyltransferase